jgi:hypothetical protein
MAWSSLIGFIKQPGHSYDNERYVRNGSFDRLRDVETLTSPVERGNGKCNQWMNQRVVPMAT